MSHYPDPCPLCNGPTPQGLENNGPLQWNLRCQNCGTHRLTTTLRASIPKLLHDDDTRARVAHAVRKVPVGGLVTTELVRSFIETAQLPGAMERIDNLVLMLATDFAPGQHTTLKTAALCALIGTATEPEASWVMNQARGMHYVLWVQAEGSGNQGSAYVGVTLTIDGWRRHAELMRDGARSRHAFMAMKFGNEELSRVYSQRMRPAVAETGFDLRTTNEDHKTAGSIDNRMRVEIRTSRFTVCDLTHGNQGAYWEAGFAEGLGRPVFYTCRSDVLRDRTHADHPHFDTAHQLIIPWDATSPAGAMQELKDVIRATLPDEARMQDNRAI